MEYGTCSAFDTNRVIVRERVKKATWSLQGSQKWSHSEISKDTDTDTHPLLTDVNLGATRLHIGPIGVPPRQHEKFTMPGDWYDDEDDAAEKKEPDEMKQHDDKQDNRVSVRQDQKG